MDIPSNRPSRPSPRGSIVHEPPPVSAIARRSSYPWFVVGTVCIGAFMGQLDASIAQLVLPTLESAFHERFRVVGWVALAYLLTLASTLPVFGRLADMVGRKMLYTTGFLVFVIGSVLCGAAPTLAILIAARAFQAVGAGLLQANSVAIITAAAGPERRGRAIGIQGAAQAIGLCLGPALGGFLIQTLSWRWVFWINVPAGLIGVILGLLILPRTEGLVRSQRFDWWGALLLAPALTALLLAMSEGPHWGFGSAPFIGSAVGAAVLLALFVAREGATRSPLVDLSLFRVRAFAAGNLSGLLSYGILFGVFFLVPFALERGRGETPLMAGLVLTAVPLALGVVAPLSGALADRIGSRPLTVAGMVITAGALVGLALAVRAPALTLTVAALSLFGVGQGLFTAPNNSAIMGAASPRRLGVAGGVLNLTRSLGTSLGVAVAAMALSWRLASRAGRPESTLGAPRGVLLNGIHDTLLFFAAFALVAAVASLVGERTGNGSGNK